MDLTQLSISAAIPLLQTGAISPVELAEACLARIEALDGALNCFITRTPEQALEGARRAEATLRKARQAGDRAHLLCGIPMAYKDLYQTRGVRTTAGSTFFRDFIPEESAFVVGRLEEAGAVLLGKLNMHEVALGVTNVNPHYGACRNPWDPERVSGGSSGGSAAALAAQLCLGSLGTDTGGSIRIPASLCGVVGLKPTYGRVSLRGVLPLSWNLDHAGPLARCVRDAALLLEAIAGCDPLDPASCEAPQLAAVAGLDGGVQGWEVALASDEFFAKADPEVSAAVERAAEVFTSMGARVTRLPFPEARAAAQANGLMVQSDAAAFHRERLATHPEGFGADVRQRLQNGAAATAPEYALARHTQNELRRAYQAFFNAYRVLLTPATPVPAPLIVGPDAVEQARLLTRFTAPFNLTGLPALVLPCGFTRQGLPVGLQIVGGRWAEADVLRAGYAYEQAAGWQAQSPSLPHSNSMS